MTKNSADKAGTPDRAKMTDKEYGEYARQQSDKIGSRNKSDDDDDNDSGSSSSSSDDSNRDAGGGYEGHGDSGDTEFRD